MCNYYSLSFIFFSSLFQGKDYPGPVVDHDVVMKANLARMKQAYAAASGGSTKEDDEEEEEEEEEVHARKRKKNNVSASESDGDRKKQMKLEEVLIKKQK